VILTIYIAVVNGIDPINLSLIGNIAETGTWVSDLVVRPFDEFDIEIVWLHRKFPS
jgi:hypothetical protein